MAHGDKRDCEQLAFGLFPNGDGRPSSKASHLIADDVPPLSCDQKWIDPAGRASVNDLECHLQVYGVVARGMWPMPGGGSVR